MLGKDKLVFDTSATLSDNDNVGAFLRASDGTLITHTGGALNVNVSNASIVVTATDLDIRDLDAGQDNVAISDGTDTLAINNDGSINITDNGGSITVDGTVSISGNVNVTQGTSPWVVQAGAEKAEDSAHASGDIGNFMLAVRNDGGATSLTSANGDYSPIAVDEFGRMLTVTSLASAHAEDSAHASGDIGDFVLAVRQDTLATSTSADGDYAAFKVTAEGALYVAPVGNVADDAADSGNPIKVGSRSESGALSAVGDGDRADLLSDDFRRIYVNSGANISVEETAVSVTTTATALPATALTGRRKIYVQNLDNQPIFLGGSGVTTANGIRIAAGAVFEDEVGDDVGLFAINASGTADVRVLELA